MNSQEQHELCPVAVGDELKRGKVIYIFGDSTGWDVCLKNNDSGEIWFRIEGLVE